jgi:biotin synthase
MGIHGCSAIRRKFLLYRRKDDKNYFRHYTLSIGEKTFKEYKAYRGIIANRCLLKIETSDETLYNKLNPGMTLKNRMLYTKNIKNWYMKSVRE